jgi:transcriptional regulator with XRE-family HTH domain
MLDWTQVELAKKAGVSMNTIRYFERGARTPHESNRRKIREALEAGGIEFLDRGNGGPGARLRG